MSDETERIARLEAIVEYQSSKLDEIGADVKLLLQARSFARGALWLAAAVSGAVSVVIGWLHK